MAAPAVWTLQHRDGIDRFTVQFPGNTAPAQLPPYVRLRLDQRQACLQTAKRRGAAGTELWVAPSTLPRSADGAAVTYAAASAWACRWYRLWRDPAQQLAAVSTIVAIVIAGLETIRNIGQTLKWGTRPTITLTLVFLAVTLVGLLVTFMTGLIKAGS